MGIPAILLIGSILLAGGSGSFLLVRWSNPLLKGLGWLGVTFAAGGCGALLLLLHPRTHSLPIALLADSSILFALVLLHISLLELLEADSLIPYFGIALEIVLIGIYIPLYRTSLYSLRPSILSTLEGLQALQTTVLLIRRFRPGFRFPLCFCISIIFPFAALNLFRPFLYQLHLPLRGITRGQFEIGVYAVHILFAMGVAFGFFWLTTAQLTSKLEHMAGTDPLTRTFNRRSFLDWCKKEVLRSQRTGLPFSILLVDLDHFKKINDRLGHHIGDAALIAVVEQMQDSVRGIDVLGRWGGEEFVILLPHATQEAAMIVALRICRNVAELHIPELEPLALKASPHVTVSIGVATYRGAEDSIEAVMERGDSALYEAKASGRNRVIAQP